MNEHLALIWLCISLGALTGSVYLLLNGHLETSLLALIGAGVFRGLALLEREFGG